MPALTSLSIRCERALVPARMRRAPFVFPTGNDGDGGDTVPSANTSGDFERRSRRRRERGLPMLAWFCCGLVGTLCIVGAVGAVVYLIRAGAASMGACCARGDGCVLTTAANCATLAPDALFHGNGSTCADHACAVSCCCSLDGSGGGNPCIQNASYDACRAFEGTCPVGTGVVLYDANCSDGTNVCDASCCCVGEENSVIAVLRLPGGCEGADDSLFAPVPNTLQCVPNTCYGACCQSGGECFDTIQFECIGLGTWQGLDTSCSSDICLELPPTGACCFPTSTQCIILTNAQCEDAGSSIFLGADTLCDACPTPPPPPPPTCTCASRITSTVESQPTAVCIEDETPRLALGFNVTYVDEREEGCPEKNSTVLMSLRRNNGTGQVAINSQSTTTSPVVPLECVLNANTIICGVSSTPGQVLVLATNIVIDSLVAESIVLRTEIVIFPDGDEQQPETCQSTRDLRNVSVPVCSASV